MKVGSGDITAYPMLREIAKLSLPVILSTGLSTIGEIRSTIDFIKSVNRFYNNSKYQYPSMYVVLSMPN